MTPRAAGPGRVTVDMGRPVFEPEKIPTTLGGGRRPGARRAARRRRRARERVVRLDGQPARRDLRRRPGARAGRALGPRIERHPAFPNRVNVEFAQPRRPRPHPPAHLGARHRRDARLRERCLRGRRGIHAARRRRARGRDRAARRRARDRLARRRRARIDDRTRRRGLRRADPRSRGTSGVRGSLHRAGDAVPRRRGRRAARCASWSSCQIAAGVDGLVPVRLDRRGRDALPRRAPARRARSSSQAARGRVQVLAGTGSNSTREAIELTRHAKDARAPTARC